MGTESVQSPGVTLFVNPSEDLKLTFGVGVAVEMGEPVKITGDFTIAPAGAADDFVGFAMISGGVGDKVSVLCGGILSVNTVTMKGGTATAGDNLVYNGTVTDGVPEVAAGVATNIAKCVVLSGGIADANVKVGILRQGVVLV
jgi:hypothetical protein